MFTCEGKKSEEKGGVNFSGTLFASPQRLSNQRWKFFNRKSFNFVEKKSFDLSPCDNPSKLTALSSSAAVNVDDRHGRFLSFNLLLMEMTS